MKINDATIEAALNAPAGTAGLVVKDFLVIHNRQGRLSQEDIMRSALSAAETASDLQTPRYIYRNASNGEIVSADYARDNPDTTTRERV